MRGASRTDKVRRSTSNDAVRPEHRGAVVSRRGFSDRLLGYLAHHRASLRSAATRLRKDWLQTLLSASVVAIALALPALMFVAVNNLQALGNHWDAQPTLTLYVHPRASDTALENLLSELTHDIAISSARFISSEQALNEFRQHSGFGDALQGLSANPLPAAIEIEPSLAAKSVEAQRALAERLRQDARITEVVADLAWVERFLAITDLARRVVLVLAVLLACGAVLAVGNTVRLIIENRKDEIVVVKLVGGTDGFVRRPLLYAGGAYGCVGGVIACSVVALALWPLTVAAASLVDAYSAQFRLQGLTFSQAGIVICSGTALGWLGAVLAVSRHLRMIEPK